MALLLEGIGLADDALFAAIGNAADDESPMGNAEHQDCLLQGAEPAR